MERARERWAELTNEMLRARVLSGYPTSTKAICERYVAGSGLKHIAHELNAADSPSPRAQQGRPSG